MDPWSGLGTAVIAAVVSLLTTMLFRWLEKRQIRWVVTGEAHTEYVDGRPSGRTRANLELHNAGDADAYDVRLTRCNGAEYKPWQTFEAGKLASGEAVEVRFSVEPESWETAWFEVTARATPTGRSKSTRPVRFLLHEVTGKLGTGPLSDREQQLLRGQGKQLPETS